MKIYQISLVDFIVCKNSVEIIEIEYIYVVVDIERLERINEYLYVVCNIELYIENVFLGYRFNFDNLDFQI